MIVVDKRFATPADVREVTDIAHQKGYKVIMVDVDADLHTSIARVHGGEANGRTYAGRHPNGEDPVVPVNVIKAGYRDVVRHRREVMQIVDEYYLYKSDVASSSSSALVAEHRGGEPVIHEPALFEHVTRNPEETKPVTP